MSKKNFLYHIVPAAVYVCLILLFLLSLSVSKRLPEILSLTPEEVRSGDLMIIEGNNFRDIRSKSRVWLDDVFLPASAIEYWSDDTIKVRIPPLTGSGLVYVETPGGRSKGALYILSERLPDRSIGAFLPGKPYLATINRSSFKPGGLVVLSGDKLGARRKNSSVLINLTGELPEDVLDAPDEEDYLPVPDEYYYNWTDNEIAFFLPEEAVSGPLYVRTAAGYSNPVTIEVEKTGEITLSDSREWTLSQKVMIDRVGSLPGNSLNLWIPRPDFRPGQELLDTEGNLEPFRFDGNLQVFRISELTSGHSYEISRQYRVSTQNVEFSVNPEDIPDHYENQDVMSRWLKDSEDIPVDYFTRTAAAVVLRERNPYAKGLLIYEYIQWKLDPDLEGRNIDHTQWMTERVADSLGYASFFTALCRASGVPARMVSGIFVPHNGSQGIPHYWAEISLPGVGWFPVDPSAPDGMLASYLPDDAPSPGGWGYLDNRYIAFSRGNLRGIPFRGNSRRIDFQSYSQQNIFEEWIGHLESCSVQWSSIDISE